MKPTTWLSFSATLLFTAACGNAVDAGGPGMSGAGAGATSGPSAGPSGSDATGTGSGGGSGDTVTLSMTPFDVPSGAEMYKCQNFANPFGGDAEVRQFESHMTPGSHHLLVFFKGDGDAPLEDCSGLEFAPTPYSTQLPDDTVTYPDGVAALVKSTTGFRLQSHYLNTTGQTIKANVSITFHLAEAGTVTAHAGVLFMIEPAINVPPGQTQVVKHDCQVPFDMSIVKSSSHMHKHGTKFTSTIAGETLFDTTQWSDPLPAVFDPPRPAKGGDPIHFECTFVNNGTTTLTFGESAETNEMCILGAGFFPVPGDKVTLDCD